MLAIKDVNKSYGNKKILKDVNIDVKQNEILGIIGPSGAGKTTLLRCITGLEPINSGEFTLNGRAFNPNGSKKKSMIGLIFQNYELFPNLTVMQNITLAPRLRKIMSAGEIKTQATKLIKDLDISNEKDLYPYQLSGGQKQRVAIVRALMMKPKILCYDEPTSALDPALVKTLAGLIYKLKQRGMTQIIVSHDLPFAKKVSDRIVNIKKFSCTAE
ncbi:amino acid ABC transporter ATP-binding protein [Acetilactobacillus jinshanensis]|uniref:Amino acid ABC transporter ATP-binding protein n=1 Tax=Acetilactobacillus jinshanensis TaxID=1720083 RepID=A0A4P6ZLT7_9LACO|nr:ATP-binding cassette domain-containing protein [Acetilactobacillus jinshanensis]QBP18825.1 amino acid ABC transporter ATP-binding protein [Acetilactobacillus jinshanensis]URL61691.1 amino acid ABC transporter ATP-binding protein [uncultured bacterium]